MFRPEARLARTALAAALAAAATAGLASEAHATQVHGELTAFAVSDGSFAGQPPTGQADVYAVDVATVDGQSVWKLTTDSAVRSVSGTCERVAGTTQAGPTEIHCRRGPNPGESLANLGAGDDRFVAAPGFPDRLRLLSGEGNDTLTGGVANDVINGGNGDNVLDGREGDDDVTLGNPPRTQFGSFPKGKNVLRGGDGKDFLFGGDGDDLVEGGAGPDSVSGGRGLDRLIGGDGDDSLNGTEDAFQRRDVLDGGPGADSFLGDTLDDILARDGVADSVGCRAARFVDTTGIAEVDLKDTISFGDRCTNVLRAPVNERPSATISSATVRVAGRNARVAVACATSVPCAGKIAVKVGGRTARATYRVAGKRTRSVSVRLPRATAKKLARKGTKANVTLTEAGIAGARTVTRAVTSKRS